MKRLLSTSRHERRHAFDQLVLDRETSYAARELLTFDEDASVRARAALFLAKADPAIARPALEDALDDEMPLVRHAASRALASTAGTASSLDRLRRTAEHDPIWWVRRAAIVTSAMLGGADAIPTLRAALDDPFWRVRSAAVRALLALGADGDLDLARLEPATTPRSEGALGYIARRLGAKATVDASPVLEVHNAIVARLDPDPAVVTARLDRGDPVTTAFLVECLGDPHRSLRATARKRLARSHDLRALELALLWLDEPRIPHAAQTVIRLLDSLDREDIDPLLEVVFDRGGPGALCWAISYLSLTGDDSRIEAIRAHAKSENDNVRRVAEEALVVLEGEPEDADPDDLLALSSDPDPKTRAAAIGARIENGERDPEWSRDPDPWVRSAALDERSAREALASDPQPWVRRAAWRIAPDARLAARSGDPWLQTRAAARLSPRVDDELVLLLGLARDSSPAVRAAAADALERTNVDDALDRLIASKTLGDEECIAALAHRSRHFTDADLDRLRALESSPRVRAWIEGLLDPKEDATGTGAAKTRREAPVRDLAGVPVSALVVSGAGMLPSRAYAQAHDEGATTFFWEPRYHTLGKMLARTPGARIACGSYEATERAIVHDVDRYLRRLRRDTLDVFLLFWVRSPARVDDAAFEVLARLKEKGKVRAIGFSTHDREIATNAIHAHAWDVVMIRHSAVHPGAEAKVFPAALEKKVGIFGFSALSYGRVLSKSKSKPVSAADAYRYSLSQPGVTACLSAPRTAAELEHNLAVLRAPPLSPERCEELRAHGRLVHEESKDFARSIRRHPLRLSDAASDLERWLDREEMQDTRFE